MKGFLGCCYQRDVPPETIQNLRIFQGRKSVVFAHLKKCATTTRKIFLFFLGWAHPERPSFLQGGPAPQLQACKLSSNLFLFLSCIWDIMGYIYSWSIQNPTLASSGQVDHNKRRNMSEASEELKRIAAALEEILRLVKQDQEKFQKINEKN